jgi:hypothetical protein
VTEPKTREESLAVFQAERNMDLSVRSQSIPDEWSEEDRQHAIEEGVFAIGPNEGVAPRDLDLSTFTDAIQMTNYEFGAYETYGDARCDVENVQTLDDLFGSEFAERFFKRKRQLIAKFHLNVANLELEELQARIAHLEAQARGDDPPTQSV